MKKCAVALGEKNDRSGELTKKADGNINSAAKNGKVERGMLLVLKGSADPD